MALRWFNEKWSLCQIEQGLAEGEAKEQQLRTQARKDSIRQAVRDQIAEARRIHGLPPDRLASDPRIIASDTARANRVITNLHRTLEINNTLEKVKEAYALAPMLRTVAATSDVGSLHDDIMNTVDDLQKNLKTMQKLDSALETRVDQTFIDTRSDADKQVAELAVIDNEAEKLESMRDQLFSPTPAANRTAHPQERQRG